MSGGLWSRFEAVAHAAGGKIAILQGHQATSYAELNAGALRYCGMLTRRGLGGGGRCLFWSANSAELAAALLGAWRAGAVVVLVSDEAPVSHLLHAIKTTAPAVIVTDRDGRDAVTGRIAQPIVVLGSSDSSPVPEVAPVTADAPASVFFTSGSTGLPKGVTQTHRTLATCCAHVASYLSLATNDRILCPIPWSFDYGYGQLLSTLLLGVTQILPAVRTADAMCTAIALHRPTVFAGLPSIFALLLRGVSPLRTTDVSSLRLITNTGGTIPEAIFSDLWAVFHRSTISLNYGMTETYRSAGLPVDLARAIPHSVGLAYPGVTLTVVRDDGSEAAPGEVGELIHKGAGTFSGYWDAPDPLWDGTGPTATVVYTGDLATKDERGFLAIRGRRDRLIKSMSVRVSPDEVENLLRSSEVVVDAAIIGVPHEVFGQIVTAFIVPKQGAIDVERKLKTFARETMSKHMQPRHYVIVERFPLTPNGKTDFGRLGLDMQAAVTMPPARAVVA